MQGEKLQLSVVVIDPLTIEAVLELDVLSQCSDDLHHNKLITSAGNGNVLNCQGQDKVDPVDSSHKETLHHDLVTDVLSKQGPVSDYNVSENFYKIKLYQRNLLVSVTSASKQESCQDSSLPPKEQANSVFQQEFLSVASQASSQ